MACNSLLPGLFMLATMLSGQAVHEHDHGRPNVDGPAIFIQPRSVDLGTIIQGQAAAGKVTVGNNGNADLVINEVVTSCGCTVLELADEQRTIPPGETRELTVRFDSAGRQGREHNVVVLLTNDPVRPESRVMVTARVEMLFKVLPDALVHLRSARRGVQLPPLEVFPTVEGAQLQDLQIEMPPGLLEIEREDITSEKGVRGVRLLPRVPEEMELGDVQGSFLLHGVVDGKPVDVRVQVTGQVVSELRAIPATLQSLAPTLRGHKFAPVVLESVLGKPFQVLTADAGPFIEVSVKAGRNASEWELQTALRDTAPDGPFATILRVRTDNTAQPVFEIPIFAYVRPRVLVEPPVVLLGHLAENRSRAVRIQVQGATRPAVRELRADPARLTVVEESVPAHLANVLVFRVGLPAGDPPLEDFTTEVILKLSTPEASDVTIPVEYLAPR